MIAVAEILYIFVAYKFTIECNETIFYQYPKCYKAMAFKAIFQDRRYYTCRLRIAIYTILCSDASTHIQQR